MSRSKKNTLTVETLGARELMSATAILSDGILSVTGSDVGETITVRQTSSAITVDGVSASFTPAEVQEIRVWGLGGDDTIRLHQNGQEVTKPSAVYGGGGDDVIFGGMGNDLLDGTSNSDTIFGFEGNDFLAGDTGNDFLYGGSGHDRLAGGDGADNMSGDAGNDTLAGGTGDDDLLGGPDADFNYDADWFTTVVDSDYSWMSSRPGFAWFDDNLTEWNTRRYGRTGYRDSQIGRQDMIDLLRNVGNEGVTSAEHGDLMDLTTTTSLSIPEHVRNLGKKVVFADPANVFWTGGGETRQSLGNLAGGSTESHMDKLVDKWFLGKDRPEAASIDNSVHYTYRLTEGALFQNGASKDDVDQGGIGDCYFLASLGAVAETNDSVLSNMFIDNGDETFTVRFFKPDGTRDFVTVDRYLPTNLAGNFVFANNSSGKTYSDTTNELWVALAEKAYAQINESGWIGQDGTNSYNGTGATGSDGINNGSNTAAMEQITGVDAIAHSFNDKNALITAIFTNKAVTICTSGIKTGPVVANHCYTVTAYNGSTDKFTLYNPWAGANATIELSWGELAAYCQSWSEATI